MLQKSNQESQESIDASYVVAYEIAKREEPFSEEDLSKTVC